MARSCPISGCGRTDDHSHPQSEYLAEYRRLTSSQISDTRRRHNTPRR
jgi:hypothetical protein